MKRNTLFLFTVCLIFLFGQCKKDEKIEPKAEPQRLGVTKLTKEEKSIVPYKINDELVFENLQGNSIIYNVHNIKSQEGRILENANDYYSYENYLVTMQNPNGISLSSAPSTPSYKLNNLFKKMELDLCFEYSHNSHVACFHGFVDTAKFYMYDTVNGPSITFHDSIKIANKTFYNIYELNNKPYTIDTTEHFATCFYNLHTGVVGFTTNKGKDWALK
jgi:hypothetical protein